MNDNQQAVVVILAMMILMIVCGLILCFDSLKSDEDNNNNNQPRTSFQELIRMLKYSDDNPSTLQTIPVVRFKSRGFKDRLECVVCLSELLEGDKAKVLPSCNHWFHVECIDAWFQSNSTCPICRIKVNFTRNRDSVVINIPAEPEVREWPITVSYLNSL